MTEQANTLPPIMQISMHAPLFDLTLTTTDHHLLAIDFGWAAQSLLEAEAQAEVDGTPLPRLLTQLKTLLDMYFDGQNTLVPFKVIHPDTWAANKPLYREIIKIKYGKTITYNEIASKLGWDEEDVIDALLANPCPFVIPCHRVVFEDSFGPWCGEGGAEMKGLMLQLEGADIDHLE